MKPHLPLSLLFALSLCTYAGEGTQDAAEPNIVTVNVHSAADVSAHASESAVFEVIGSVDATGVRTTGDCQRWVGNNNAVLTLGGNRTEGAGGAVRVASCNSIEDPVLPSYFTGFTALSICDNTLARPEGPVPEGAVYYGGAIYGEEGSELSIRGNGSVNISNNSSENGGAIYVRSHGNAGGGIFGSLTISDNKSVTFAQNTVTNKYAQAGFGGALNCTAITISGNKGGTITFSGNVAGAKGGAINVDATGFSQTDYLHITDNTSTVLFSGNRAQSGGGAICAVKARDAKHKAKVLISGNSDVIFEGNSTKSGSGSAILADALEISGNGTVKFKDNENHSGSQGGAVYADGLVLNGNDWLEFSGNSGGADGLAVFAKTLDMKGNKNVLFKENTHINTAFAVGALFVEGGATVQGNAEISFIGNESSHECAGFVTDGTLNLTGNGKIYFKDNVGRGVAAGMYVKEHGDAVIANNEYMEFRNNIVHDKQTGLRYLRGLGIYGRGQHRTYFSASEGYDIVIYDSAVFTDCPELYLNAVNKDGELEATSGKIVFSGRYSQADLGMYTSGTYTERELQLSRTSSINRSTTLYGGTISVEDDAILALNGLNVRGGAVLELSNGAINNSVSGELDKSFLTMEQGSMLVLSGANSLKARTVTLEEGSSIKFFLESREGEAPMLAVDAELVQGGTATLQLIHAPVAEDACLVSMAAGTTPADWDFSKISLQVGGEIQDNMHLYWQGGALYYSPDTMMGWTGEQSNVWANNSDANWSYYSSPGVSRAYRDNASLYIKDVAYDCIELRGDLTPAAVNVNVASGKELSFTGDGRLVGGTALHVGGGGTLVVDTANANTGNTVVTTSTLRVTRNGSLGSGSVTLNGATLEVDSEDCAVGHLVLNVARVVLGKDAALRVSAPVTVSGASSISGSSEGGSHIIADALELTRKAGTGTPWVVDCTGAEHDASSGSGFTVNPDTVATVKVFDLAEGAALDLSNITVSHYAAPVDAVFTYNAATGEFSTGKYTSTAWNRYIIRQDHNSANMNYAAILEASRGGRPEAQLQEVRFRANDSTLLVNRSVDQSMVFVAEEGVTATLNAAEGTRLYAASLTGPGSYVMAGGGNEFIIEGMSGLPARVSLDPSWSGKLVLTGDGSASALQMQKLCSGESTLVFQGYTARLGNKDAETSLSAPVELRAGQGGGPALVIAACDAEPSYSWNGPVYGSGDIVNRAENDLSMVFSGDVAGWSGAFVQEGSGTASLNFTETDSDVYISLAAESGKIGVKLGDEAKLDAASIIVFNGAEIAVSGGTGTTVDALTLGAGHVIVTESDAVQAGMLSVTGSLTAGSGSAVYARLGMMDGALLDLQTLDGVSLDYGALVLHAGLVLGQDAVNWLNILKDGGEFTLFTHVDELSLPEMQQDLIYPYSVEASQVFGNIAPGAFELVYTGSPSYINGSNAVAGTVFLRKLVPTPEPATGTLSLLALAALASRRRRK